MNGQMWCTEILHRLCPRTGPAQGLGLRPHQKTKFFLRKKVPLFIVKGPIFIKLYIFSKSCTLFFY